MSRQAYIKKQRFTVMGEKNINLEFEIDEERVVFFNLHGGTEFVFKNRNEKAVLLYWREVIKCMDMACLFALNELDKNRVVPVVSTNRASQGKPKAQTDRSRKAEAK